MKNKILLSAIMSFVLLAGITSCDEERTVYDGPQYIMFADTLSVLGVENSEDYFDVYISATQAMDKDLTLAVEVIEQESSAIEGVHYVIESNTVTLKAGELATSVRIRGIYENLAIDVENLPEIKLRLISPEETHWGLYEGLETKVLLQKVCPFDINAFSGYAMVTSTFLYNYVGSYNRLIETSVDTTDAERKTIIMHDYLYDGYDVKVRFTTDDTLNPLIEMDDQPMATTGEAFGTIYGDGMLHLYQPSSMVSYYSSCEKFILQYITIWVPGMEAGANTVGTFVNAVEWISDDEARILKQQGY
ncbi:MAG: DUF4984 domain-containing protein [Bacteroidaceae bacterium]|nr:DUF4984 domain-containing protein [Bacteroidaceae bacterium]